MNDYKITYTTEAGESFTSSIITERTEAAARKYFTTMNKGLGFTVSGIELVRENTTATKQQERDTLAAIKKMVEELGPQSYLATAFAGCFQDAEDNIDDDAAYSMKARYETEAKRAIDRGYEVDRLKKQIERMELDNRDLRIAIERVKKEDSETITALQERALSPDDLCDVSQLVAAKVLNLGKEVASAAERIVEMAVEPDSAEFQNAVKEHRAAKSNLAYYTAILSRVNCQRQLEIVDFRRNKMSFFGGRHSSLYSPFQQPHLPT